MRGRTTTCTALVAVALLFLLTGLVAADVDLLSGCNDEWEACAADPECVECNTTSLCDFVTSDEATCADIETTICCTFDAIEECGNNEAYSTYHECFWSAFGCLSDGMSISDYCSGETEAASGSPGIAPAAVHSLAAAVVAGVVISASGFQS